MRILSRAVVIIGVIVTLAAMAFLFKLYIDVNQLNAVANANRSVQYITASPAGNMLLASLGALAGGFLMGLGVSMPKR